MEHCGVVDRKELEDALACSCSPVHHLLEIIELTHSEVVLCTEREHRNRSAGTLPITAAEAYLDICLNHDLILLRKCREPSVLAILPCYRSKRLLVGDEDLICERLCHVECEGPIWIVRAVERHDLVPLLESLSASCEGEHFIWTKSRSSHLNDGVGTLRSLLCLLCRSAEDGVCEC